MLCYCILRLIQHLLRSTDEVYSSTWLVWPQASGQLITDIWVNFLTLQPLFDAPLPLQSPVIIASSNLWMMKQMYLSLSIYI